eukprot:COSAG02_NODE_1388_length_12920_cov_8.638122_11_plen_148_part_00
MDQATLRQDQNALSSVANIRKKRAVFAGQLVPDGIAVAHGGDDPAALERRIRASLLRDIRDGKLVVPSNSTVASQRSAFAFDLRLFDECVRRVNRNTSLVQSGRSVPALHSPSKRARARRGASDPRGCVQTANPAHFCILRISTQHA